MSPCITTEVICLGYKVAIGDERSTSFLENAWVGSQPLCPREDLQLNQHLLGDIMVDAFILPTRLWDTLALAEVLPHHVVKAISEVPIPVNRIADMQLWCGKPLTKYTVSQAYQLLTNTLQSWMSTRWLWRGMAAPRIKC